MDKRNKPKVGFVPCLTFVRMGVAKPKPVKMKVTKEEMRNVVKDLRLREAEFKARPKTEETSAQEPEQMMSDDDLQNENEAVDKFYDLDDYDDEPADSGISYNTDAMLLNSSPESEADDEEDSEEEQEEFSIKPDDNLLVCGQVSDDVCMLQLYVLNTEKQEFFLLNDTFLPTYPMAVEWLDFNPRDSKTPAHYAAVGFVEPEIQVWDLDVADCLEPTFTLGSKKHKKTMRHKEAVLDLSWNTNTRNALASGSADKTVILWDMQEEKSVTRLDCFTEKVQTVQWHPLETQALLAGTCDGSVKLFDCRTPNTHKTWEFIGEIERVLWNNFEATNFLVSANGPDTPFTCRPSSKHQVSTEKGMVHYIDTRHAKPVWELCAHNCAVGGLVLSSFCKDLLITGSQDEKAKIWDLSGSYPELVLQKDVGVGHIYSMTACPDSPFVFACGGANPSNHLYVWDVRESSQVESRFRDRLNMVVPMHADDDDDCVVIGDDTMQCSSADTAFKFKEKKRKEGSSSSGSAVPSGGLASAAGSAKNLTKKKKKNAK